MNKINFDRLNNIYSYNIYEKYLNKSVELNLLIIDIEKHNGKPILPIDTEFPATLEIRKWMRLMEK